MARCEDFPCCGHEPGCCPDYDESGRQLNMKCVCGTTVPLSSRSSLCPSCLRGDEYPDDVEDDWQDAHDDWAAAEDAHLETDYEDRHAGWEGDC